MIFGENPLVQTEPNDPNNSEANSMDAWKHDWNKDFHWWGHKEVTQSDLNRKFSLSDSQNSLCILFYPLCFFIYFSIFSLSSLFPLSLLSYFPFWFLSFIYFSIFYTNSVHDSHMHSLFGRAYTYRKCFGIREDRELYKARKFENSNRNRQARRMIIIKTVSFCVSL